MNDEDRKPWLERIAKEASKHLGDSQPNEKHPKSQLVVISCSELKRIYRNILIDNIATHGNITYVFLDLSSEQLHERMKKRAEIENHFMPSSLIESQLKDLEKPFNNESDRNINVITIDGELALKKVDQIGTFVLETLMRNQLSEM